MGLVTWSTAANRAQSEHQAASVNRPRVLAIIDDAATGCAVVGHLLGGVGTVALGEVILLNVQPKPNAMQTRGLFKEVIRSRLQDIGMRILAPAAKQLDEADVSYCCRVELGDYVDAALHCAKMEGCELIVVGSGPRSRARWHWMRTTGLTGRSTACQLAELADAPVLVVRPRSR